MSHLGQFRNFLNFFQLDSRLVFFVFRQILLRFLITNMRVNIIQGGSESFILITLLGIHLEARSVIAAFK